MGLQAPATRILSMLTAPQAKTALQALMGAAGKTCADLLLHRLPPAAAELLTRHFEADEGTPGVILTCSSQCCTDAYVGWRVPAI